MDSVMGVGLQSRATETPVVPEVAARPGHVRTREAAMPAFESRIPAPLTVPEQAPVINGPLSQPALRGICKVSSCCTESRSSLPPWRWEALALRPTRLHVVAAVGPAAGWAVVTLAGLANVSSATR